MPIYFKWLKAVPSIDIVAHRIVWSLLALAILATLARAWDQVRAAIRHRRTLAILFVTALLIGTNWLLYVYAINSGHILAGSLGYYLNPLANILLGRFILKERLSRAAMGWRWRSPAGGIAVLAAGALGTLWISLTLCFSFATYGLLRKIVHVESLAGLTIETALLFPIALGWLLAGRRSRAGRCSALSGTETVAAGGRGHRLDRAAALLHRGRPPAAPIRPSGMLQFIAPTLQFLLAVAIYDEPFTRAHAIAFGCIWTALALYLGAMVRDRRAASSANAARWPRPDRRRISC